MTHITRLIGMVGMAPKWESGTENVLRVGKGVGLSFCGDYRVESV